MKERWDSNQSVAKEMCSGTIEEAVEALKADNVSDAWIGYSLVRRGVRLVTEAAIAANGDREAIIQCLEHALVWGQEDWAKKERKRR